MKFPEVIEIAALDAVEIAVEPWTWPFAQARRADINRHFAIKQSERPTLWNGRVLLMHRENRILRGASFETDYASFLAWRDWGCPEVGVYNVFAAAALQSADAAFLLGQMAPSTSSAGQWVFPCGTPDPDDINSTGRLDLVGNVGRELLEETGLDIGVCQVERGWTLVRAGGFVALMKRVTVSKSAEQLVAKITQHLTNQAQPEFSAVGVVRSLADVDPATPQFYVDYLMAEWS